MSKRALTDAGVGRAMFATRVRLSLKAAEMCLFWGSLPLFFATWLYWLLYTPPQEASIAKLQLFAKFLPADALMQVNLVDDTGKPYVMLLRDRVNGMVYSWVHPADIARIFADTPQAWQGLVHTFWLAIGLAVAGYCLIWFLLRRTGSGAQDNTRIRGANELVSVPELKSIVRKMGRSEYSLVEIPIPKAALGMGFLVLGAQGSGKSMAIHDLMLQVFAKKRKSVIYDYKGEFYAAHFRPGIDHFFNPSLEGSVPWSIFSELRYTYDSDTLARAFLPPSANGGAGEFFRDAARALFSVLLVRLANRGAVNTADLARAFLEMPAEEMDHLIQASVASSSIGGDSKQQRQGVLSSIAIYLNGIAAVGEGAWTIRDWLAKDDDSRLYILNTKDTEAMFAPLYRLMLSVAFANIAARQELVHEDRYWFWLDELHQLGDIKLDDQLATLRAYGVSVVTGLQSDSQLVASMGQARADTLMNCLNTSLLLLAQEASLQQREAKRLGELEVNTVNRNQALSVSESRDGAGLNNLEAQKWVVMPSEFGTLQPLTGFLKMLSEPGVFVDYRSWNRKTAGLFAPYRDAWKFKVPMPGRNPSFLISRPEHAADLQAIRAEVATEREAAKAASAAEAAKTEGTDTQAKPASKGSAAGAAALTVATSPENNPGSATSASMPVKSAKRVVLGAPALGAAEAVMDAEAGALAPPAPLLAQGPEGAAAQMTLQLDSSEAGSQLPADWDHL